MKDIKIVVVGGGTGLSTMLRGLKKYTSNLTAIVTVSDNGGGSGVLRQDLNMLPPGDIRNCIVALSNTEPMMEKLFKHRFEKGMLKGQSFGNLFLAAMNEIYGSFEEAVRHTSEVLNITGKVLPVTSEDVQLCAKLESGAIVCGESEIVDICKATDNKIVNIYLTPPNPEPLTEAIDAIMEADIIVLGPGSLYTSVIPNLLVNQISEAIKKSEGFTVYIGNVMTQPGETDGYSLYRHVEAIEKYLGKDIIEYVIANTGIVPEDYIERYRDMRAEPVLIKEEEFIGSTKVFKKDIMKLYEELGLVRHDPIKLAASILEVYKHYNG